MAEQKESSVLFSLKELMNLEEDRIKQEDDARKAKEQAEVNARLAAERAAQQAEEARLAAETERRRQEEQRQREEQARLQAIQQAEVLKAQADAENQARLAAMRQQQEHAVQMASLAQDKKKKQLTYMVAGIAAVLILALGGGGFALKSQMDKAEKERTEARVAREAQEAELAKLKAERAEAQNKVASLEGDLANAKTDAEKLALQKKLDEARDNVKKANSAISGIGPSSGPAKPAGPKPGKPCNCQPGDPLCSCL